MKTVAAPNSCTTYRIRVSSILAEQRPDYILADFNLLFSYLSELHKTEEE